MKTPSQRCLEIKAQALAFAYRAPELLTQYQKDVLDLLAHIEEMEAKLKLATDALGWVLPMAKGYAFQNPVGRNLEIVTQVSETLAQLEGGQKP